MAIYLDVSITTDNQGFHSYASRIGSKSHQAKRWYFMSWLFPFIRFTNWKQVVIHIMPKRQEMFPFIRFTNWKQDGIMVQQPFFTSCFHSYASRIGSKYPDETFFLFLNSTQFPFIRFTNWKQDNQYQKGR